MPAYEERLAALCGIGPTVRGLMAQYCADQPAPRETADFFAAVEFEALPAEVTCMAAAVCAAGGYAGTPAYVMPRLRGITKYVHTLNAGQLSGLCAFGRQCREKGIPLLTRDATAIRLAYPDCPQRHLWQVDASVPAAFFQQALSMARRSGYEVRQSGASANLRKSVTQSMMLYPCAGEWEENVCPLERNGVVFMQPTAEALLVGVLEQGFRILYQPHPGSGLVRWLMDAHALLSGPVDWAAAAGLAAKQSLSGQMLLMLDVYRLLAGRPLPEAAAACFQAGPEANRLLVLLERLRAIPPGTKRARRLWLLTRLEQPEHLSGAAICFLKRGAAALLRRLAPPG